MFYIDDTTIEIYWCHIKKEYIDFHAQLCMDAILRYQSLGYDVTIIE